MNSQENGPVESRGHDSISHQTDTGGGAHIDGSVEAGKDVIGRDQITAGTVNIYHGVASAPPDDAVPTDAPTLLNRSKLILYGSGLLIGLITLSFLAYRFIAIPTSVCSDARHCVLIAEFVPPDDALAAEVPRKIYAELANGNLLPTAQFNVQQIDVIQDADQLRQVGMRENAQIIIWGQLFQQFQELKINFELTNQLGVAQSNQLRPFRVQSFEPVAQSLTCTGDCFEPANLRQILDQLSIAVAHTAAGMLHYGLDQAEEADREFFIALHCIGEPVEAEAQTLTDTGCNQNLATTGFNAGVLYYYAGKSKILTGDYATALAYLERAADENLTDPAPLIAIATLYQSWLEQSKIPAADVALTEATQRTNRLRTELVHQGARSGELAMVDYELGFIAELQRDWERAATKYQAAIEAFGPESKAAYVTYIALARVQQRAGMIVDAEVTLQQAHNVDPTAPWALLALAEFHQQDQETARLFLADAHDLAPNQAYIDIVEAQLCTAWQDFDCAKTAYQRALEKRPDSGWLYGRIGDFYSPAEEVLPHQDWAKATEYYRQGITLRPNDPWAHERLAFALFYQGDYAKAAEHFAVSLHDLSHPRSQLAERYCTLAQAQLAAAMLDDAFDNAQICLARLENPDIQPAVETLLEQIRAAQR